MFMTVQYLLVSGREYGLPDEKKPTQSTRQPMETDPQQSDTIF